MPNHFEIALATVTHTLDTHITDDPSLIADRCVAAIAPEDRPAFVTALFGVLTDAAWDVALNAAVDAGYDPWTWTASGRPTDTDYLWMICRHWATEHQRYATARRHNPQRTITVEDRA